MSAVTEVEDAWDRLLDRLRNTAAIVSGPLGARTERERAEGYRHITRVLSIATEMLVEKGDPEHPAFTRWMSPYRKMYGDNPRTVYDAAIIDADHVYRIAGNRGTSVYLGFCLYATDANGGKRIVGNLDDDELDIGPDGSFELLLGGSGMPLDPQTSEVMVRQYFVDPETEQEATYAIETLPSTGPPGPLTEQQLAARLDALGTYVHDTVEAETTLSALSASITTAVFRAGSEYVDNHGAPADPPIDASVVVRVMPTPAIQYSGSWFDDLGDDEVLVIEGTAPTCRYWSIQLLTRFMESGDWLHHPVFLTGRDIDVAADGTFRVVVAHTDPGTGNWIDTTGLTSANIAVRALKAEGTLDVRFSREKR
ncbi:MAG: hypothetical protein QOE99_2158 [Actinomycetota bacterium]|nr:hypothetical protein [Actinomycetota bacterium]